MLTVNGEKVGKISKQWSGLAREAFTDSDNFGINFPMDLDVRCKATLLAAVFLIVSFLFHFFSTDFLKDFMFFENNKKDD